MLQNSDNFTKAVKTARAKRIKYEQKEFTPILCSIQLLNYKTVGMEIQIFSQKNIEPIH